MPYRARLAAMQGLGLALLASGLLLLGYATRI
jgi:hypothetical protein